MTERKRGWHRVTALPLPVSQVVCVIAMTTVTQPKFISLGLFGSEGGWERKRGGVVTCSHSPCDQQGMHIPVCPIGLEVEHEAEGVESKDP